MKRNIITIVGTLFLLGLFLGGCSNLTGPDINRSNEQKGGGLVSIYIGQESARTVQPSGDALAGYQLTFSGGKYDPVDITIGNHAEVYLADGTYTITAAAYKAGGVIGNVADEAARGTVQVTLSGGVVTSNGGVVPPIILEAAGEGSGTFHYEITRADSDAGYLKLWQIDGTGPINSFGTDGVLSINSTYVTGNYPLEKGRYIAEIRLTNSVGKVAFSREVLEIWPGVTTAIVYETGVYLDPSAILANSEATLAATTKIGGNAIGETISGTGDSEDDPLRYQVAVQNIETVSVEFILEQDSLFASLSWIVTDGSIPGETGYTSGPVTVSNFATTNVLWVRADPEDGSTIRYYRFELFPPPPSGGAFTDTNTPLGTIDGTITWTPPSPPTGIAGFHIYFGSDENTRLAGWEIIPRYTTDQFASSQTVSGLPLPEGTNYFLIYSYKNEGNDYPGCLAIPIVDTFGAGAFTVISTDYTGVSYSSPELTISKSGVYYINGTGTATTDRIQIVSDTTINADIQLTNVNIDVSSINNACAFDLNSTNSSVETTVLLTLIGTNSLKSGYGKAGIQMPSNSALVITEASTGTLTAGGGDYSAGIGGGGNYDSIAGIDYYYGGGGGGTVTINGGTVTATAGSGGAGIGGGGSSGDSGGSGGTVTINGGTVTATATSYGAGIGGGGGGGGYGGTVTINGGTVTATGSNGAGIGGGSWYGSYGGGTITGISGSAVVFASSIQPTLTEGVNATEAIVFIGNTGALYGNVTLSTDITIPAGNFLTIVAGGTLTIPMGICLTNNGIIYVDDGGFILGTIDGNQPNYSALTISGNAPYTYTGGVLTITGNGTAVIGMKSGVTIANANYIIVAPGISADVTLSGVTIDVSDTENACAFDMTGTAVNLTLAGNNILKSGGYKAGLQVPDEATLVITAESTGTLTATGGSLGAGIGGGNGGSGGTVTINGGTVTATGSYSAGIGGRYGGSGGTVTITGGTVTATGSYSAGIGVGSGGTVTINGGTVTATGSNGAGIGGGSGGNGGKGGDGGTVTINGGTVTATGSNGAGIGGGGRGNGGTVTITGGTVTATNSDGVGIGGLTSGVGTITEISGGAVVFASSIGPALTEGDNATSAVVFISNTGTQYGDVTLGMDVTFPEGKTLTIPAEHTLTIPVGKTLTNNGSIINQGTIAKYGVLAGNAPTGEGSIIP